MNRGAITLPPRPSRRRGFAKSVRRYDGAQPSRLTSDWFAPATSADAELRNGALDALRKRSRDLERNNDYVRRILDCYEINVVGADGIRMQSRVTNPDGTPDTGANVKIEKAFADFSKRANFTITKRYSRAALERLIVRTVARDGEIFIRILTGARFRHGITLQPLEGDYVDHHYNVAAAPGRNSIQMGIELSPMGETLGYWTWPQNPSDVYNGGGYGPREFIPASEMIHIYDPDRLHQSRGVPVIASSMVALKMLRAYEEAELAAARAEACKMGIITKPVADGSPYSGQEVDEQSLIDLEPGTIEELQYGQDFKTFDPTHPGKNFAQGRKEFLRAIASGQSIGYNTLAQDLEGVNYSSLRSGALDEREKWKSDQAWLIESFHEQLFPKWLEFAILSQQVNLPSSKLEKFTAPVWRGRRWPWVDPLKDVMAAKMAIALRLKSRRAIISEMEGGDSLDTFNEFRDDEADAEAAGIELPDPGNEFAGSAPAAASEPPDAETEDGAEDDTEDADEEMDRAIMRWIRRSDKRRR